MHGGIKIYAGSPAAARQYLEADRGRADDYYLADGTGIARRFAAGDGRVVELRPLTGDNYEAWVAGRNPETGLPRGRLRPDDRAVRFVEVVFNGPKSWSLAAALHRTSPPPTTRRRTAPPPRSSRGWPTTPRRGWARPAGRCRSQSSGWRR